MVRAGASFENHLRWCQFGEERFNLNAPDLAPQYKALLLVDPVDRKNMLGRVNRNTFKVHWTPLSSGWLFDPMLAHSMPLGRPPQHKTKCKRRNRKWRY
jgi:hypothetical protein